MPQKVIILLLYFLQVEPGGSSDGRPFTPIHLHVYTPLQFQSDIRRHRSVGWTKDYLYYESVLYNMRDVNERHRMQGYTYCLQLGTTTPFVPWDILDPVTIALKLRCHSFKCCFASLVLSARLHGLVCEFYCCIWAWLNTCLATFIISIKVAQPVYW